MATATPTGYTRVTVVAPGGRLDLALPHAATVGELLPQLLSATVPSGGEPGADASRAGAAAGWVLGRFGEPPLDTAARIPELGLYDGELLHLRRRAVQPPMRVFDDVVEAIGQASRERPGHWRAGYSRTAGLAAGAGLLATGALFAAAVGGPIAAAASACAAVLLLAAAAILSRAYGDSGAATVLAVVATAYATAAGAAALAGDGDGTRLLLASAVGTAVAAMASVVVGDHGPVYLGIATAGAGCGLAGLAALCFGAGAAPVAALTAAAVIVLAPLAPMVSLRLAGVALPTVPGSVQELRRDAAEPVPVDVLERTTRADDHLSALLAAGAALLAGAGVLLAFHGGVSSRLLCLALALVLALRARLHPVLLQRLVMLLGGVAAVVGLAVAIGLDQTGPARAALAMGVLAAAGAIAFVAGLAVPGRRTSPYWGRALDWLEAICLTSVIPLAVAVPGWYGYFHGLGG